jgi:hypothetical protein
VVYRLLRSASSGDGTSLKPLFFTSTRGLNVNDTLTFKRHSDGTNALGTPDTPAIVVGTAATAPFSLLDGDQLNVTTNTPAAIVSATIVAKPAAVQTSGAAPNFILPDGATLQLRVGPAIAPVQLIIFSTTDPNVPITAGAATLSQVQAVLTYYTTGLRISQQAGQLVLETEVHGTDARLEVVDGTAITPLFGAKPPPALPPAGCNVPDAAHVTMAQLAGLLTSPNFTVDEALGHVRFTTAASGGAVTIQLSEGISGVLQRLGFGAVSTVKATGTAATPSTVQIASYDLQSNSIVLTSPLSGPLDVNNVSATVSAPSSSTGPSFIARYPGAWSAGLTIAITNADRAATQVTGPVAAGLSNLPIQSVTGLYIGAVIEVDHNGANRSIHQVTNINSATRVITIDPVLPAPALTVVVNPATDKPAWVRALEVDVTVTDTTGTAPTEVYRGLSWNQDPNFADLRRHYAWAINARSRLVFAQPPGVDQLSGSEGNTLTSQPTTPNGFPMKPDTIGAETFNYDDQTWIGLNNGPGARSGIQSLIDLTEARIISTPGITTPAVQAELIDQCELLRFRFAILDGELDPAGGSITSILTHRNLYDTSFAAYYQSWVTVSVDGQNRYLPPSGYLAGIYARVDEARGVWKAPANEPVLNVIGLKTNFTKGEQDLLNPRGVDLIRKFDRGSILVWGGRTLSSDPDVKYINVRRTLIFLEASIAEGTRWVVFEPNALETWSRLTTSVSAFLLTQWREGALFGSTPEQAFFVRCDETTMAADEILNGILICQVGVALVRPAEFVVFRIEQITNFGATPS